MNVMVISLVGFSHFGEKKTSRMDKIYISKLYYFHEVVKRLYW